MSALAAAGRHPATIIKELRRWQGLQRKLTWQQVYDPAVASIIERLETELRLSSIAHGARIAEGLRRSHHRKASRGARFMEGAGA